MTVENLWYLVGLVVLVMAGVALIDRVRGVEPLMKAAESLLAFSRGRNSKVDRIIDYADRAVRAVEQMYQSGQIPADQRFDKAVQIVEEMFNVDFPEEEFPKWAENAIEAAIEAAVQWLEKTHPSADTPSEGK